MQTFGLLAADAKHTLARSTTMIRRSAPSFSYPTLGQKLPQSHRRLWRIHHTMGNRVVTNLTPRTENSDSEMGFHMVLVVLHGGATRDSRHPGGL